MNELELHRIVNRDKFFEPVTPEQYTTASRDTQVRTDVAKLKQQWLSKCSRAAKNTKLTETQMVLEAKAILRNSPTQLETLLCNALVSALDGEVLRSDVLDAVHVTA